MHDDIEPVLLIERFSTDVLLVIGVGFVQKFLRVHIQCADDLLPTGASRWCLLESIGAHMRRKALGVRDGLAVVARGWVVVNQDFTMVCLHKKSI